AILLFSCSNDQKKSSLQSAPVDEAFLQDYSIKYYFGTEAVPLKVAADRNGTVQVLTKHGLYRPHGGAFVYPGELIPDRTYLPVADKTQSGMGIYQNQFLYVDDKAVFGNAWADSLFMQPGVSSPRLVGSGDHFAFFDSDGAFLAQFGDSEIQWRGSLGEELG